MNSIRPDAPQWRVETRPTRWRRGLRRRAGAASSAASGTYHYRYVYTAPRAHRTRHCTHSCVGVGCVSAWAEWYRLRRACGRCGAVRAGQHHVAYPSGFSGHAVRAVGWALCPPLQHLHDCSNRFSCLLRHLDHSAQRRKHCDGGHKAHPTRSPGNFRA